MSTYEVVSKELHKNLRWNPTNNFAFAANEAMCPLVTLEVPKAALHIPIVFSRSNNGFGLFALQSLEAGNNYFVDSTGSWLAGYIPAAYRGYPFALNHLEENKKALCVDSSSASLSTTEGHPFFDSEGEPSPSINDILNFLIHVFENHVVTHSICNLLNELDLYESWPITVKKGEQDVLVEGIFRINEVKFNSLDSNQLTRLRDAGALPLIYCQLLSMQNLEVLIDSAAKSQSNPPSVKDLQFGLSGDEGNINFDGV